MPEAAREEDGVNVSAEGSGEVGGGAPGEGLAITPIRVTHIGKSRIYYRTRVKNSKLVIN